MPRVQRIEEPLNSAFFKFSLFLVDANADVELAFSFCFSNYLTPSWNQEGPGAPAVFTYRQGRGPALTLGGPGEREASPGECHIGRYMYPLRRSL